MMQNERRSVILLVLAAALLVGCAAQQMPSAGDGSSPGDIAGLIAALRDAGATVEQAGTLSQPFFDPEAQLIRVNGQDVQVFEFASAEQAAAAADLVSEAGDTIGTTSVSWIAPPHFYRSGRIVVLYVGSDQELLALLTPVLGEQFAGAS